MLLRAAFVFPETSSSAKDMLWLNLHWCCISLVPKELFRVRSMLEACLQTLPERLRLQDPVVLLSYQIPLFTGLCEALNDPTFRSILASNHNDLLQHLL